VKSRGFLDQTVVPIDLVVSRAPTDAHSNGGELSRFFPFWKRWVGEKLFASRKEVRITKRGTTETTENPDYGRKQRAVSKRLNSGADLSRKPRTKK